MEPSVQGNFQICVSVPLNSRRDRDLKSWHLITSDRYNLPTKVQFLLKSGSQLKAFFVLLKVGHLIAIVINFVYK